MIKIGILGASGKMGKSLIREVLKTDNCKLVAAVVKEDDDFLNKDISEIISVTDKLEITANSNIEELFKASDVVIDFTSPESSIKAASYASKYSTKHVIGTTGFSEEQKQNLANYAKNTVIIVSSNMSLGVNLLAKLVEQTAKILGDSYDIEIVEMHHNKKVDAPSGTALMLGESAAKGIDKNLEDVACKSRDGIIGARPKGEIGFSTIRGGDVVGEHTVIFASNGERIELTHKASDRSIFCKGAVRASIWSEGKPNGLYNMHDVIGR